MSAQARVVERYTVNQDGSRLDYTVSVTDPPNLVKPAVWDAHLELGAGHRDPVIRVRA